MRKASAHGLGHLRAPYDQKNPAIGIPEPATKEAKLGVSRWQHDIWWTIVNAALNGNPDHVDLSFHPKLSQPAVSRYGATTPKLLKWFSRYNEDRLYAEQVKPFGFLLSLFGKGDERTEIILDDDPTGARPRRPKAPKPIAPFDADISKAVLQALDREDGSQIEPSELMSYAEALGGYHLHAESKFLNAGEEDRGTTHRRHIFATKDDIEWIGKEANRWEEQFFIGFDDDATVHYEQTGAPQSLHRELKELSDVVGQRELADRLGLPRSTIARLIRGEVVRVNKRQLAAIRRGLADLRDEHIKLAASREQARQRLVRIIEEIGLKQVATQLGVDPSNLRKVAEGSRGMTDKLLIAALSGPGPQPVMRGKDALLERYGGFDPLETCDERSARITLIDELDAKMRAGEIDVDVATRRICELRGESWEFDYEPPD